MTESLRAKIRAGELRSQTSGLSPGRVQVNLVILSRELAGDFRLFCERNPRPCPLIEQTEPGEVSPPKSAPTADVRTDAPLYRVYRNGELREEVSNITAIWREDLVSFLLGCSFNFEEALVSAGIPVRHQEEGKVVPMYVTNRECEPAGSFAGPLVVSMRPIPKRRVDEVREITSRHPEAHGEPVHVGAPGVLGIAEVGEPDFGQGVTIRDDEVPAFWACGVTPQAVARRAKPELLITHAPGHMFITDLTPRRARLLLAGQSASS